MSQSKTSQMDSHCLHIWRLLPHYVLISLVSDTVNTFLASQRAAAFNIPVSWDRWTASNKDYVTFTHRPSRVLVICSMKTSLESLVCFCFQKPICNPTVQSNPSFTVTVPTCRYISAGVFKSKVCVC